MKRSKAQMIVSSVKRSKISVGAIEFHIQMKNSIDDVNTINENDSENTIGYLTLSELEKKIKAYRWMLIKEAVCQGIDVVEK